MNAVVTHPVFSSGWRLLLLREYRVLTVGSLLSNGFSLKGGHFQREKSLASLHQLMAIYNNFKGPRQFWSPRHQSQLIGALQFKLLLLQLPRECVSEHLSQPLPMCLPLSVPRCLTSAMGRSHEGVHSGFDSIQNRTGLLRQQSMQR